MQKFPLTLLAVLAPAIPACGEAAPPANNPESGVIRVTASYPGASARVVADTVAAPIEQQVNGVEGMNGMESESRTDGSYTLTVHFGPKMDLKLAQVLVQNRVSLALPILPNVAQNAGIAIRKSAAGPSAFWLAVTSPDGTYDSMFLANYAREGTRDDIGRMAGVADVRVVGAGEAVLQFRLDPEKLAARDLTAADVVRALEQQNLKVTEQTEEKAEPPPAKGDPVRYTVTTRGRLINRDELGDVILKSNQDGKVIRMRDVAQIKLGAGEGVFASVDGKPAALLSVTALRAGVITEQIRKRVEGFVAKVPKGLRLELVADLSAGEIAMVKVRLPDTASQARTEKSTVEAIRMIRELPGVKGCTAFGDEVESNMATLFVNHTANGPALADIRKLLRGLPEAVYRVSAVSAGQEAFPIRIAICDTKAGGEKALREAAESLMKKLAEEVKITDGDISPGRRVPKLQIAIDRMKIKELGVTADDVAEVIRVFTGSRVDDDFGKFGRNWRISPAPESRTTPADLAALQVRNDKGQMVRLGTVGDIKEVQAERVVTRVNLYPALIITANPPDGTTAAEAAERCMKLVEMALPKGYRAENLRRR